jgi:hypothetical protein
METHRQASACLSKVDPTRWSSPARAESSRGPQPNFANSRASICYTSASNTKESGHATSGGGLLRLGALRFASGLQHEQRWSPRKRGCRQGSGARCERPRCRCFHDGWPQRPGRNQGRIEFSRRGQACRNVGVLWCWWRGWRGHPLARLWRRRGFPRNGRTIEHGWPSHRWDSADRERARIWWRWWREYLRQWGRGSRRDLRPAILLPHVLHRRQLLHNRSNDRQQCYLQCRLYSYSHFRLCPGRRLLPSRVYRQHRLRLLTDLWQWHCGTWRNLRPILILPNLLHRWQRVHHRSDDRQQCQLQRGLQPHQHHRLCFGRRLLPRRMYRQHRQ